uniref:ATP synthase F0 subunit 8 n=1 Tax=Homolobus sp. QL-2013 TaxID=1421595 RepID=A0A0A6ZLU5_9HYME|nr:ATP synthase F0 subunit 8 [Homolobus sp. QL-2013]
MPQMSNLDWMFLLMYFLFIYLILMIYLYFMFKNKVYLVDYLLLKNKYFMKWY